MEKFLHEHDEICIYMYNHNILTCMHACTCSKQWTHTCKYKYITHIQYIDIYIHIYMFVFNLHTYSYMYMHLVSQNMLMLHACHFCGHVGRNNFDWTVCKIFTILVTLPFVEKRMKQGKSLYPLENLQKNYWTWPFIVDFPIKNGDFP